MRADAIKNARRRISNKRLTIAAAVYEWAAIGSNCSRVRLLFVTQDFAPSVGGIQTYCRELASRLAPSCRELVVVAPAARGASEIDRTLPYRVHRLPVVADRGAMAAASSLAIPALCRGGRFDVVFHAQWS